MKENESRFHSLCDLFPIDYSISELGFLFLFFFWIILASLTRLM